MVLQLQLELLVMELRLNLSTGGLMIVTSKNASCKLLKNVLKLMLPKPISKKMENVLKLAHNIQLQRIQQIIVNH